MIVRERWLAAQHPATARIPRPASYTCAKLNPRASTAARYLTTSPPPTNLSQSCPQPAEIIALSQDISPAHQRAGLVEAAPPAALRAGWCAALRRTNAPASLKPCGRRHLTPSPGPLRRTNAPASLKHIAQRADRTHAGALRRTNAPASLKRAEDAPPLAADRRLSGAPTRRPR